MSDLKAARDSLLIEMAEGVCAVLEHVGVTTIGMEAADLFRLCQRIRHTRELFEHELIKEADRE